MNAKLYALLARADGAWTIEEVARELRVSKTAVRRALTELHDQGAIALVKEEEHGN